MGNILQTYSQSTEKVFEFKIWKLTAECGCMITYKISRLLGLSGLWAANSARWPLHSHDLPLLLISSDFRARYATFSAPAPLTCSGMQPPCP